MEEVLVSVLCLTYNHEDYIRDALNGFVSQKTDFKFEVLIHDDASTDQTQEIIREYEEKYPDIIKPIYQTENQFSQGIKITQTHQVPRAKGKYLALCEGDDYWIDPNKLQKQIDYLRNNPDCTLCVTATKIIDCQNNKTYDELIDTHSRDLTTEEVIEGGGGFFSTASMVFEREKYINKPELYLCKGIGDYPLAIYLATLGKVHYISDVCTAYRFAHSGSWTASNANAKRLRDNNDNVIALLNRVDDYTQGKYSSVINNHIKRLELSSLLVEKNYIEMKKYVGTKAFKALPKMRRIKLLLKIYLPFLLKIKQMIKPNKAQ